MIKEDIEKTGKITVGKYIYQDKWAKGEANYFTFYIDGKKFKGNGGRSPKGFSKNIGKFYKIRYSEKYKGRLTAFFNEEVTDTINILKSGFTKEDLKK
ncbi:hypothetical protein CHU92_12500 [Flavobacterium cyanobacteriorum]|uniref:Uncharacterized protein n=2 Tax=Flavobacterium cyanobacteriorum TaxID=2022802 RepID=A0A255YXG9_9FLAO|nr:hypothetical protein CHU92_12500 [Flavobacterium cyanobacteriorum]